MWTKLKKSIDLSLKNTNQKPEPTSKEQVPLLKLWKAMMESRKETCKKTISCKERKNFSLEALEIDDGKQIRDMQENR